MAAQQQLSPADAEKLMLQLMSADNAARGGAEQFYAQMCSAAPEMAAAMLLQLIAAQAGNAQVRSLAAVLLRRVFHNMGDDILQKCGAEQLTGLKATLLATLQAEADAGVRNKVCDVIGMLADKLLPHNQWPELLPYMFGAVTSPNAAHIEGSLRIFATLPEFLAVEMVEHFPRMAQVFGAALGHASPAVQLGALQALGGLLLSIDRPSQRNVFQPLVPAVLAALGGMLGAGDSDSARGVLTAMVDVAETQATFFRPHLANVVEALLQLAGSAAVEENVRQMAAELLLALAEGGAGMVRKLGAPPKGAPPGAGQGGRFVEGFAPLCFDLMMQITDDAQWEQRVGADEANDWGFLYEVGRDAIDRMARAIGAKRALPSVFTLVMAHAAGGAAAPWQRKHTALTALTQVLEVAPNTNQQVAELIGMVLPFMQDPHPRVRYAAIIAVGQMSSDHAPKFQKQHHATVLPTLVAMMDDACLRVQAHATCAALNFVNMSPKGYLEPYVEPLLSKLFVLIRDRPAFVQEDAMTCVSAVAEHEEGTFATYYDTFMPVLKHVFASAAADDPDCRMLRCKCLECISFIGVAVGPEKFGADAAALMAMMGAQAGAMEEDDPQRIYMLMAWGRIAECLGDGFLPYLPTVMPHLLAAASVVAEEEVQLSHEDAERLQAQAEDSDDDTEVVQVDDKQLVIRTALLEDKASACQLLATLVKSLGAGCYAWVQPVMELMAPLAGGSVHGDIRAAAATCMADLVLASSQHHCDAANRQPVAALLAAVLGQLVDAMQEERDIEVLQVTTRALGIAVENACAAPAAVVAAAGGATPWPSAVLSDDEQMQVLERLLIIVQESFQRRAVRAAQAKAEAEDYDEEDEANDILANREEINVQFSVSECLGSLIKTHRAAMLTAFRGLLLPKIEEWGDERRLAADRKLAAFIVDDVMEFGMELAVGAGALPALVTMLLKGAQASAGFDGPLAQASVYGLGLAAKNGGAHFAPLAPQVLAALGALIQRPGAFDGEDATVTDNAVSALGLLCEWQKGAGFDASAVLAQWLQCLPLRNDLVEGRTVLGRLCDMVQKNDADLLGGEALANLPRIVGVLATAAHEGMLGDALMRRAGALLAQVQAQVPAEKMQEVGAALSAEQQQAVQALLAAAAPAPPSPGT